MACEIVELLKNGYIMAKSETLIPYGQIQE